VARTISSIIRGIAPNGELTEAGKLVQALTDYAKLIEPWARSVAAVMVADVARRDKAMWAQNSKEMSTELRREIEATPTGSILRRLQDEQVSLITSIPLQAAERVHEIAEESILTSARHTELVKHLLATSDVTTARARLIARTETTRATSNLMQARAVQAGSDGYIWRTSGDADVRDSHAEMEGKYVRWAQPPVLDGLKGHAGTLPNCRCFSEPVFPDD